MGDGLPGGRTGTPSGVVAGERPVHAPPDAGLVVAPELGGEGPKFYATFLRTTA